METQPLKEVDVHTVNQLPRKWKICILFLLLVCILLLVVCIILAVKLKTNDEDGKENTAFACKSPFKQDRSTDGEPNLFQDLTETELKAVHGYLQNQVSLNLTVYEKATLRDNFIYVIELLLPNKKEALEYLDKNKQKPKRCARAIIFHGAEKEPFVREYAVEYLPNPTNLKVLKWDHIKEKIPYYGRPFTFHDSSDLYGLIKNEFELAYPLLKDSFDAWIHNCTDRCINWLPIGQPGKNEIGKRYAWIQFNRADDGRYLYFLPLQMLVEYSDPNNMQILEVVYNNQKFDSVTHLMSGYRKGTLKMVHLPAPNATERLRASLHRRGPKQPPNPMRGPTLVEPNGKRFSIIKNKVSYMNWQFEFGIRATGGLGIYDVRFQEERIAYEISLQEGMAYYSGYDPKMSNTHYLDSNWGLGTSNTLLMKDIDCPLTAVYIDSAHLMQASIPVKNRRSICVFETSTGTPLWRHFDVELKKQTTGADGMRYQGGLAGHALVIRVVSTPFNYDYFTDYILHQNGIIEVRITASGYIQTSFATEQEKKYGFVNFFNIIGSIHDHFALYKVDLDIAGVKNSYQTIDSVPRNISYEWEANTYRIKKQIVKSKKDRERDALLRYDFNKPKYYVFINENEKNAYGNPKGYRIDLQNKVKQLYSDDYYMNDVCAWSKYQMSVTKRKDLEPFGSIMYNQYMFSDPALNFDNMVNDNEAIENEDLVAWVNIGGLHIPNTEDIPLTTTVGSSYGFLIKPFGYFDEDPSQGSTTSFLVEKAKDGKDRVYTYGTPESSSCPVPKRKVWI